MLPYKFKRLKIVNINTRRAYAFCVNHNDKHRPSMSIDLQEPYYGYTHCWTCGYCDRLSTSQMNKLGLSKVNIKRIPRDIDWNNLSKQYYNNLIVNLPYKLTELCTKFGIADNTYGVEIGWDGEAYTFPMYKNRDCILGIQRRWLDGKKRMVDDSRLGLFLSVDLHPFSPCFITEGVSDMLSVSDLDFYAVGKPSALYGNNLVKEFVEYNEIERVIILPDNDSAGIQGAGELHKMIKNSIIYIAGKEKDIRKEIEVQGKESIKQKLESLL